MARQKGRLMPLRNYDLADSLLHVAFELANEAAAKARDSVATLNSRAVSEIAELRDELAVWHEALNGSLAALSTGAYLSKADLALMTSEGLYRNDEFMSAIETVTEGRESLTALGRIISDNEKNEKREIDKWKRWVDETLNESRKNGSTAVIVDKSAHKLYLAKSGKLLKSFECELGYNSAGHKLFSGDGATPEGMYHITRIKHNGSKYYKAALINYPNDVDKKIFDRNKARGIISKRAGIGALIEIHGEGGRGIDWTNGCVALRNDDISDLMKHVSVGTPVTIVRRSDLWPR